VGYGGVGIIRVSGSQTLDIAKIVLKQLPKPRYATFTDFYDAQGNVLDQGIALYFPAPHSFTGEDVLELQGHGGIIVMDELLKTVLYLGARLARAGEFSERAFLNGKLDLAQAEAIADLIESTSTQAARCALRSLQGEFSQQIHSLVEELLYLRSYIEAGIDFVDEEIDVLADGQVVEKIKGLLHQLNIIVDKAQQGFLLKEGMRIVLIGEPNVGKSSLLNQLAGRETAIVTPIAGTTRDIVSDQIQLDGMPLHIIDTAGLRETVDPIEREGISRTKQAIEQADVVIILIDERNEKDEIPINLIHDLPENAVIVRNKIDKTGQSAGNVKTDVLYLSAKTGLGITDLKNYLKQKMGFRNAPEGSFIARRRHLTALNQAQSALKIALSHAHHYRNELLAEELRAAQLALSEITGEVTSEDVLERIFSTFCIGK